MSLFITLEGPDGGGKSTQALRLVEYLRGLGLDVLMTREPGGTAIGDQIRRVLTDLGNTPMHPRTELLLFSASRAQLCHEVIRPHLQAGGTVVSDRFYDSTFAYQGYGHSLDLEALRHITTFATGGLVPDLTLLLGSYTGEYQAAVKQTPRKHGRRFSQVRTDRIVVEKWGHMRNLQGRAYAPELIPSGVSIDEIK